MLHCHCGSVVVDANGFQGIDMVTIMDNDWHWWITWLLVIESLKGLQASNPDKIDTQGILLRSPLHGQRRIPCFASDNIIYFQHGALGWNNYCISYGSYDKHVSGTNRYNRLFLYMSLYENQEYSCVISSVTSANIQHYRRLISLGGGVMWPNTLWCFL